MYKSTIKEKNEKNQLNIPERAKILYDFMLLFFFYYFIYHRTAIIAIICFRFFVRRLSHCGRIWQVTTRRPSAGKRRQYLRKG